MTRKNTPINEFEKELADLVNNQQKPKGPKYRLYRSCDPERNRIIVAIATTHQ
ncbi:MAG: hypothetical protein WBD22_00635 [Pyrinomonadaceae bacterium]